MKASDKDARSRGDAVAVAGDGVGGTKGREGRMIDAFLRKLIPDQQAAKKRTSLSKGPTSTPVVPSATTCSSERDHAATATLATVAADARVGVAVVAASATVEGTAAALGAGASETTAESTAEAPTAILVVEAGTAGAATATRLTAPSDIFDGNGDEADAENADTERRKDPQHEIGLVEMPKATGEAGAVEVGDEVLRELKGLVHLERGRYRFLQVMPKREKCVLLHCEACAFS